MKPIKILKRTAIAIILFLSIIISTEVIAQDVPPPPPPPGGGHGQSGNQRAPIGGGLFILLGLGAAYGGVKGYKFYQLKKKKLLG